MGWDGIGEGRQARKDGFWDGRDWGGEEAGWGGVRPDRTRTGSTKGRVCGLEGLDGCLDGRRCWKWQPTLGVGGLESGYEICVQLVD